MKVNQITFFIIVIMLLGGCAPRTLIVDTTSSQQGISTTENQGEQWANSAQNKVQSQWDNNVSSSPAQNIQQTASQGVARMPFPVAEYAALPKQGSSTIEGQVYLGGIYGDKVLGSNTRLYLNPVTSYSNQWYTLSYLGKAKMEKVDKKLYNYLRFTTADANGNFAFHGVPRGSYYLIGTIKCKEACGYTTSKVVRVVKKVSVNGTQTKQEHLTRAMQVP